MVKPPPPLPPMSVHTVAAALRLRHVSGSTQLSTTAVQALATELHVSEQAIDDALTILRRPSYDEAFGLNGHAAPARVTQQQLYDTAPSPPSPSELKAALTTGYKSDREAALLVLLQDGRPELTKIAIDAIANEGGGRVTELVPIAQGIGPTPAVLEFLSSFALRRDWEGDAAAKAICELTGHGLDWVETSLRSTDPGLRAQALAVLRMHLGAGSKPAIDLVVASGSRELQQVAFVAFELEGGAGLMRRVLDSIERHGTPAALKPLLGYVALQGFLHSRLAERAQRMLDGLVPEATIERNAKAVAELPAATREAAAQRLKPLFKENRHSKPGQLAEAVARWAVQYFPDETGRAVRPELGNLAAGLLEVALLRTPEKDVSEPEEVRDVIQELRHRAHLGEGRLSPFEKTWTSWDIIAGKNASP